MSSRNCIPSDLTNQATGDVMGCLVGQCQNDPKPLINQVICILIVVCDGLYVLICILNT